MLRFLKKCPRYGKPDLGYGKLDHSVLISFFVILFVKYFILFVKNGLIASIFIFKKFVPCINIHIYDNYKELSKQIRFTLPQIRFTIPQIRFTIPWKSQTFLTKNALMFLIFGIF